MLNGNVTVFKACLSEKKDVWAHMISHSQLYDDGDGSFEFMGTKGGIEHFFMFPTREKIYFHFQVVCVIFCHNHQINMVSWFISTGNIFLDGGKRVFF